MQKICSIDAAGDELNEAAKTENIRLKMLLANLCLDREPVQGVVCRKI